MRVAVSSTSQSNFTWFFVATNLSETVYGNIRELSAVINHSVSLLYFNIVFLCHFRLAGLVDLFVPLLQREAAAR